MPPPLPLQVWRRVFDVGDHSAVHALLRYLILANPLLTACSHTKRDVFRQTAIMHSPSTLERGQSPLPTRLSRLLAWIIAVSLMIHVLCMVLGATLMKDWRWAHHPVHASVEMAGGIVAFLVALLLLSLDRRQQGTSFNIWISGALVGMGLLDGMHALVHVGQPFVWLHSSATFVGGLLFATVWAPATWARHVSRWWTWAVFGVVFTFGLASLSFPELTPTMVVAGENGEKVFSGWANFLNVAGGILMILASAKLLGTFRHTRNTDDLLFFLHCVLFGAAAVMFEQSKLWDLTWWGWHLLRVLAYVVALWFLVLTVLQEQKSLADMTEEIRNHNFSLEQTVSERTSELRKNTQELAEANKQLCHLQLFADHTDDGMVIMDAEAGILWANPGFLRTTEYSLDEVLGKSPIGLLLHDQEQADIRAQLAQRIENRESFEIEVQSYTKSGRKFWQHLGVVPIGDHDQQLYGLVSIHRDISRRKQAEEEREKLNRDILDAARQAGMAEVATGILHNVGNILNSVNVSASVVHQKLSQSRVDSFNKACEVIQGNKDNLAAFFTTDTRGVQFPELLQRLSAALTEERDAELAEIAELIENIEHIKEIVSMQQSFAQQGGQKEHINPVELFEDAIRIQRAGFSQHQITLVRDWGQVPSIETNRHDVLQILINLVKNAVQALDMCQRDDKTITVSTSSTDDCLSLSVTDNGVGISPENLPNIFQYGFTTKPEGHGFGLHSCANAAQAMGGSLSVYSDGEGQGATFMLSLPISKLELCEV